MILAKPDPMAEMARREKNKAELEEFKNRKLVADSIAEALRASLKPLGTFNIPQLLDSRRLEFGIPNGAFESYPAFDQVYIWQIAIVGGDTFVPGGNIIMPDQTIAAKRMTAPRGVLVSAGLQAMDALYSTGIELGHIIRFKKMSPFVQPIEEINGHELTVMVVRDGDIVSSEDLASKIHNRKVSILNTGKDSNYDFRVVDDNGTTGPKVPAYYDRSM
jgi:hypothetical protein